MLPGSGASADGGGMHSAPILAPRPVSDGLHRAHWERTIAGYIVDAIEPIAMLAVIGLALAYRSRSSHKNFLIFASIALALMASRRLKNAIVAWTDLQDLTTYAWLATVMWVPAVAAWVLAWNHWCPRPWRSIDVSPVVLAVAATIGALIHSASVTRGSRLGSIALFVLIGARMSAMTHADPGARHFSFDCGRAFRGRVARSDRRAGHLVSVRHRRVADTVRLGDCCPILGLFGRSDLGFKENASIGDVEQLISHRH